MKDLRQKLLATFLIEQKEHLDRIRAILDQGAPALDPSGGALEEAFRRAHSLKGAARAVDLRPVEALAHRLETLFAQVREGRLGLTDEVLGAIHLASDSIEDWVGALADNRPQASLTNAMNAVEDVLGMEHSSAGPSPEEPALVQSFQPVDTVRIDAHQLDQLLRSAGRLLTESLTQDAVTVHLDRICHQVADLERDWQTILKSSALASNEPGSRSGHSWLKSHVDSLRTQLNHLSRQVRTVQLKQRRSSWTLRHLGEQLEHDVKHARMVPAESVYEGFRKMVRDLSSEEGKQVEFRMTGLEVKADRVVLQTLKDPVMHLLRNAVAHGIESPEDRARQGKAPLGHVMLRIEARGNRLVVDIEDDGAGIDVTRVAEMATRRGLLTESQAAERSPQVLARLIFEPGLTTSREVTELSGRGLGLAVVHEAIRRLQGDVEVRPRKGPGTWISLSVPLSVSTHRLLLVSSLGQTFALPVHAITRLQRVKDHEVGTMEGKPVILSQGHTAPLVSLGQVLKVSHSVPCASGDYLSVVLLKARDKQLALTVDRFVTVMDAVIQDLGAPALQSDIFEGGVLLEDGSLAPVLNPPGLIKTGLHAGVGAGFSVERPERGDNQRTILVVDDSITTRTLETSILEAHGYRVLVAVDGVEALIQLRSEPVDLVVADIQMPRMDGFGLLAEMKKDPKLAKVPIMIVSSLERPDEVERGMVLGADAYIVKQKFDQQALLDTIEQLL